MSPLKVREYHERIEPFRQLTESLHRAMANEQWTEVVSLADQALEMAPESRLAQNLRSKAWAKVGTPVGDSQPGLGQTRAWNGAGERLVGADTDIRLAPGVSLAEQPAGPAVPAVDRRRGRLPGVPGRRGDLGPGISRVPGGYPDSGRSVAATRQDFPTG